MYFIFSIKTFCNLMLTVSTRNTFNLEWACKNKIPKLIDTKILPRILIWDMNHLNFI